MIPGPQASGGKYTIVATKGTPAPCSRPRHRLRARSALAGFSALLLGVGLVPAAVLTTTPAQAAPVGQGFNLNAFDLRFILKQIKISEAHVLTASEANPFGTLLGDGVDQIPNTNGAGVELPWGLRTVDGSCNNLVNGQNGFATADKAFPRLVPSEFRAAEDVPTGFGPPGSTSYAQQKGNVFDSQPRVISNLIVDQTLTNPAAVTAAGPVLRPRPGPREQGWFRHRLHAAEAGRPAEPDLHLAPVSSGVPTPVRERRRRC